MIEPRADFARRQGVNRSTVTRWAETGRIVLAGDGVDVEASLRRLAETAGARPDVADRHAAARGGALPTAAAGSPPPSAPSSAQDDRIGNSYQAARAVKEKYAALKAKADYETQIGNLIRREDVEAAFRAVGGAVRAALDVMPDQVAPVIAPVTDLEDAHALLTEAGRSILNGVHDAIKRAQAELRQTEGVAP